MLCHQQNSVGVSHSLQQDMGSKGINTEADIKPFYIRQYVVSSRQKNIRVCWPFAEKYLQLCLSHGLKNVLPPLELPPRLAESIKDSSNLSCCQDGNNMDFSKVEEPYLIGKEQNIKNELDFSSNEETSKVISRNEESSPKNCNVSSIVSPEADTFTKPSSGLIHKGMQRLSSSKRMKHKWRKRKGKYCKKKSMTEILAAAKRCTLEDLERINKLCYIGTGNGIEGCHQMVPLENNSKSEIEDEGLNITAARDYHEVANVDVIGKRTCVVNFKLNGYKSQLGNVI